jgi:hypothetical protein
MKSDLNFLFHEDGSLPLGPSQQIFVFGSNLAGRHGAGAAKVALKYGARYGRGLGPVGRTYAIPTKDRYLTSLPLVTIEQHIKYFVQFTIDRPRYSWFVTRVGCGLAGYRDHQIAPLFRQAINCSFAAQWRPWLLKQDNEIK